MEGPGVKPRALCIIAVRCICSGRCDGAAEVKLVRGQALEAGAAVIAGRGV